MNPRTVAVAFAVATFVVQQVEAAEGTDPPRGPFGPIHLEAAATVVASPSLPQFQNGAPGPIGGAWGLRAGASFLGFYGGLSFADFPGEKVCLDSFPGSCGSSHATAFGAEVGYGVIFSRWLLVRGTLGFGDYLSTSEGQFGTCAANGCTSITTTNFHDKSDNFFLRPDVLAGAILGPALVAADASFLYMPVATRPGATSSSTFAALYLGGQLGARF